jgi:thiosulfate reductase cytochrome b subunit
MRDTPADSRDFVYAVPGAPPPAAVLVYRHRVPVRIMHWINVLALSILFMSGLGIFNAHPTLYWGKSSFTGAPPLVRIGVISTAGPQDQWRGGVRAFGQTFDTTGFLGLSRKADGSINPVAFPAWLTIPAQYSLAQARDWHFLFAWVFVINGLIYVLYTVLSGHLRRDLAPTRPDLRGIGASIRDHLRLRHPRGDAARRYNVLQKLAYLVVIFILLPLVVLTGMAMSPGLNAVLAGWVDLFGGRQSARTIHFVVAWLLVAFVLIHVFEVIVSGLWNHLRSMITGYFRIEPEPVGPPVHVPGKEDRRE